MTAAITAGDHEDQRDGKDTVPCRDPQPSADIQHFSVLWLEKRELMVWIEFAAAFTISVRTTVFRGPKLSYSLRYEYGGAPRLEPSADNRSIERAGPVAQWYRC